MEHEESKRGRGRPKLANAKSAAERMKLYRQRKKAQDDIKRNVTEIRPASVGMLESRNILLNSTLMTRSDELQAAQDEIAALKKAMYDAQDKIAALEERLKSATRRKKIEASDQRQPQNRVSDAVRVKTQLHSSAEKMVTRMVTKTNRHEKGQSEDWPKSLILLVGTE